MYLNYFITAITTIACIILGAIISEYFRRKSLNEQFIQILFQKRLQAYEELLNIINDEHEIITEVINNKDLNPDQRHDFTSSVISKIAQHTDKNALYIDSELAAHCVALHMGTEDFYKLNEEDKKHSLIDYHKQVRETRRMIMEDSGISELNKILKKINKPTLKSPIIDRIRELKALQKK